VGAIYALIALGYTMVYGVLKLINFAHGDVFMVGAMIGWYVARWTGESRSPSISGALLVTLASMLVCGCLGFVIERLAYRPLRGSPRLNSLITAIGVSFFLEYGGQYLFGPNPRVFTVLPRHAGLHVGPVSLGYVDIVTVIVSVALMFGLQRIVFHTGSARRHRQCAGRDARRPRAGARRADRLRILELLVA
jgi:branched-chain amino acid transport system permease protein